MIGITKLLCGRATVSEALRTAGKAAPHLLQFSSDSRPVVTWNLTRRCNLRCLHCYIDAEDKSYKGELSNKEAKTVLDDLADMGVPVVLFSGGEPLLRNDIFDLAGYGVRKGLRVVFSTNGTLITPDNAKRLRDAGVSYAGVSIDGSPEVHDSLRKKDGAFEEAIAGIRNALKADVKAGVRLTLNRHNIQSLTEVLNIIESEGVPRFCMYHLVYAGRGRALVTQDVTREERREVFAMLAEKALDWERRGIATEILTTDNHADGALVYQEVLKRDPVRADEVLELARRHGGCSAGTRMANIDASGNVHPCQFWSHHSLGNVRERPFSRIWNDNPDELLRRLRRKLDYLVGPRCSRCRYKEICGGCRIRAEVVSGSAWGDDPQCHLTDEEIRN